MQHIVAVVLVPSRIFARSHLARLEESKWRRSSERGFEVRVDPESPSTRTLRHVHVAMSRSHDDRSRQTAWNINGTRHDRNSTGWNLIGVERAKRAARAALGLPDDFILEAARGEPLVNALIESRMRGCDVSVYVPHFIVKPRPPVRATLVERRHPIRARLVE